MPVKQGTITKKAGLPVTVNDETRMWNQRYTKYQFTWKGFVDGETENTPGLYNGALTVTEQGSDLILSVDPDKCPNYELTAINGKLSIEKGVPVAIVYGNSLIGTKALLVDSAGYAVADLSLGVDENTGYANITEIATGKVVGRSVNGIQPNNNVIHKSAMSTKAGTSASTDWDKETPNTTYQYGENISIARGNYTTGYTYSSTNPDIVYVSKAGTTCEAKGAGNAVVLATKGTEVHFLFFSIQPKTLHLNNTGITKKYDGMTNANLTAITDDKDLVNNDVIALDATGVTFQYADKNVKDGISIVPSQALIPTGSKANDYVIDPTLTGKITKQTLTVTTINKYYDGSTTATLTDYVSSGLVNGETVKVKATYKDSKVGSELIDSTPLAIIDNGNYELGSGSLSGSILYSTIIAKIPAGGYSEGNVKDQITLKVKETGADITGAAATEIKKLISVKANGANAYFVSATSDENCSIVFDSNQQIGKTSEPANPGPSTVPVDNISLDATTKTLPRLQSFTLKATLNPSDATNRNVTWESSDNAILKVEKNSDGLSCKVTALKVGKATVTVTTEDGGKTASCEVTVDFATGLEEAIANTAVYGKDGYIHIRTVAPTQAWVVNIAGIVVYHATISSATQIPVSAGIYLVKLGTGSECVVTKVNVR